MGGRMTPMPDETNEPHRNPKRQRKKEAAIEKRMARMEAMRRARRRRLGVLAGTSLALLLLGVGLFAFTRADNISELASPSPNSTPAVATPAPIACGGNLPDAAEQAKPNFEKPEDQKLDKNATYVWRLETSCGDIDIELDTKRAPKTTNSIVFLTRSGFYDGLTFHRVAPGFVIQGGDPVGNGTGGPGYKTEEKPPAKLTYTDGMVAMAKAGNEPDGTAGSQFFIMVGDSGLPPQYALVGKVTAGLEVAKKIADEYASSGDGPPSQTIYIDKASIIKR